MPDRLDFKAIAESVDIFDVAAYAKLTVAKNRATCPTCDSERAIEFYPETNSFCCHAAREAGEKTGSDCISLLAHVNGYQGQYRAAKEIQEQFLRANARETAPQKPEARTAKAQPTPTAFDPQAFASKLIYSAEVEALGISEEDAAYYIIGFHPQRKRVYFAVRNHDGSLAGFIDNQMKMPPKWLRPSNVVPLKRPA